MNPSNDVPARDPESTDGLGRPATGGETADVPPPDDAALNEKKSAGTGASTSDAEAKPGESAIESKSPAQESEPTPAPPPRPFLRALGYGLVHLLAIGAVMFVLVGLAPRVESICERLQFEDRTPLTTFVFEAGYLLRKSWYLVPLLLMFDLGVLIILRRSFDPNLARNYTTLVVALALLASILFGYGLLGPLSALYKQHL